ncbi:hypothetical protein GCM10023224_38980 [Streptomonospora halophila]|uniref:Uncharacterized protein n=1 Tax=Streptomonospora halophila TaxID=427369 RepID=A0ABP9GR50_9ACTN
MVGPPPRGPPSAGPGGTPVPPAGDADEAPRTRPRTGLREEAYAAPAEGDVGPWAACLHEDVVWTAIGTSQRGRAPITAGRPC